MKTGYLSVFNLLSRGILWIGLNNLACIYIYIYIYLSNRRPPLIYSVPTNRTYVIYHLTYILTILSSPFKRPVVGYD